jgi:hypothetical protein
VGSTSAAPTPIHPTNPVLSPAPNARDPRNPNLGAALASAARVIAPERVAQVWIFPPRQIGAKESGLAVLVVTPDDPADPRRTIHTLRYEAVVEKGKPVRTEALEEQGTVPLDRVGRIVDGVIRRLDAQAEAPDIRDLDGSADAWRALLEELGAPVDGPNQ